MKHAPQATVSEGGDPVPGNGLNAANALDASASAYRDDFAYALDNRLILNWYPERIVRLARGKSLLELGLGHGFTTGIFARLFPTYTVVEGSRAIIEQYLKSERYLAIDLRCEYFERFVAERRYDHIVMGFILEHVDDPGAVLRRYKDFLEPGGSVFVAVPNCEALNKRFGYEAGMIGDLERLTPADELLGHKRLFTVESLRRLCEAEGYSVGTVEGIFLKPITTQQITALNLPEEVLQAMLKVGVRYPELSVGILMELRIAA